jgi:hypothetical protein
MGKSAPPANRLSSKIFAVVTVFVCALLASIAVMTGRQITTRVEIAEELSRIEEIWAVDDVANKAQTESGRRAEAAVQHEATVSDFGAGQAGVVEWTPELDDRVRALLEENEHILEMLAKIVGQPQPFGSTSVGLRTWSQGELNACAGLLALDALVTCRNGDPDAALNTSLRVFDRGTSAMETQATWYFGYQTRLLALKSMAMMVAESDVSNEAADRFVDGLDRSNH